MPGKRKTEEDYRKLAKDTRLKWVGSFPRTIYAKTLWECSKNHRWEAPYRNIKRSPGCPICRKDPRRKLPAEYHALAKDRHFEWLGPEVSNVNTKTQWQCSMGHKWEAPYSSIQNGFGCPYCAGNMRKVPADYHALAKSKCFKWFGPEVPNVMTKTEWKCNKGHQWEARYNDILRNKGCPYCSGVAPKVIDDYFSLAKTRNFEWLGPFPQNVVTKTKWKCPEGHEWKATHISIRRGSGCPHCARQFPKISKDYYELAEQRNFKWIGIFPINSRTKTKWECSRGHKWEASYNSISQGSGCPYCANQVPKISADYNNLAQEYEFNWLGPLPKDTDTRTWWECKEGHHWETSYGHIREGKGCPYCYGNAPKVAEDYYELAKERNFKWLGSLPARVIIPTQWECLEGHRWEATYNNVSRGTGCPKCIDLVNGQRVSNIQRCLCEMVGGELNFPHNSYRIDVALPGKKIAIEYDSWFWHGGRLENDKQRDEELLGAGWRVLHVRSNSKLPTETQLDNAIVQLQSGKNSTEIVLEDWGQGPTFTELRT